MTNCLHYRIDVLQGMPDEDLEALTEQLAKEIRAELVHKKAAGHIYVPSMGCEGFDPVKGCPGHTETISITAKQ